MQVVHVNPFANLLSSVRMLSYTVTEEIYDPERPPKEISCTKYRKDWEKEKWAHGWLSMSKKDQVRHIAVFAIEILLLAN